MNGILSLKDITRIFSSFDDLKLSIMLNNIKYYITFYDLYYHSYLQYGKNMHEVHLDFIIEVTLPHDNIEPINTKEFITFIEGINLDENTKIFLSIKGNIYSLHDYNIKCVILTGENDIPSVAVRINLDEHL